MLKRPIPPPAKQTNNFDPGLRDMIGPSAGWSIIEAISLFYIIGLGSPRSLYLHRVELELRYELLLHRPSTSKCQLRAF